MKSLKPKKIIVEPENKIISEYGRIVLPGYLNHIIEKPDLIYWIHACRQQIKVYYKYNNFNIYKVCLGVIELRLDPEKFFRTHDSFMINMTLIKFVNHENRGKITTLENDQKIPVACRRVKGFDEHREQFPYS